MGGDTVSVSGTEFGGSTAIGESEDEVVSAAKSGVIREGVDVDTFSDVGVCWSLAGELLLD